MSRLQSSPDTGRSPIPVDLGIVLLIAILAPLVLVLAPERPVVLSLALGGLLVFFAPGWAVVSLLFPTGVTDWSASVKREIDTVERLGLAAGLSIALGGLVLLLVGLSGVPLEPLSTVGALSGFTIVTGVLAIVRRHRLPVVKRYRVVEPGWIGRIPARIRPVRDSPRQHVLVIVATLAILVAAAGIGAAMTQRGHGETFSEFAVLTEGPDGELVADGYPSAVTAGEPEPFAFVVGNNEHRTVTYQIVVVLDGDQRERLDSFTVGPVPAGERAVVQREVTATTATDSARLSFLLYRGEAPANPTAENAYHELHLTITVS